MSIQVVRRGEGTWELTRVSKLWDGAHEYELIGRVILDGEFYYVELPQWQDVGYAWHRQPRGYQLAKGRRAGAHRASSAGLLTRVRISGITWRAQPYAAPTVRGDTTRLSTRSGTVRHLVRNPQGSGDMNDEKTRSGKSSSDIRIPVGVFEPALSPLLPEPMHVGGAKRWIDSGTPDNTFNEYPGWR